MSRLGKPHQTLPNRDLDTGAPVHPGGYRLTDDTYAKLLHRLVADPRHTVPPGLKADILELLRRPERSHPHQEESSEVGPGSGGAADSSRPCP